jgi:phosphoribosylformylglycinamidine cyclo-ligase
LEKRGKLAKGEAYRTFNMGIGMIVVVSKGDVEKVRKLVRCYEIGKMVHGERRVKLIG